MSQEPTSPMRIGVNGNKFVATGDVGLLARHAAEIRRMRLARSRLARSRLAHSRR